MLYVLFLQLFGVGQVEAAARQCSIYFETVRGATSAPLNSENYIELFDLKAKVHDPQGRMVGTSLEKALSQPEVKASIRDTRRFYQILLTAKLSTREGGGTLRLVTLNEGAANLAYNHVELTSLLNVNPELANELGFYRVADRSNVVWVPDVTTVNFRMQRLAKKFGYSEGVWSYAAALGVVDTIPYLELLANGKFPFSGEADMNLAVHDAMHSIAFGVLNVTPGSRAVLEAAKTRNQIVVKIIKRLQTEVSSSYAARFTQNSTRISSEAMELTMLLSVVLTGNYDYFSAFNARGETVPKFHKFQNRSNTVARIVQLLKIFNYGHITFAQALDNLAPAGDPNREKIKAIFKDEVRQLKAANSVQIQQAAAQLSKFIPDFVFRNNIGAGETRVTAEDTAAGPETLLRRH